MRAARAVQEALFTQTLDLALDVVDAAADAAAIDFELRFARAARADAAAEPREHQSLS